MLGLGKKCAVLGGLMFLWLWFNPGLAQAQTDIRIHISDPDNPAGAGQQEGNTVYSVLSSPQVSVGDNRELGTLRAAGKPGIAVPVAQGRKVKITLPLGISYMQVPNAQNYRNYVEWPASIDGKANQITDQGDKPGVSFVSGSPRTLVLQVENVNTSAPVMVLDFLFNKNNLSKVRVSPIIDSVDGYIAAGDENISRLEFFKLLVDVNIPFASSPLLSVENKAGWNAAFTDLNNLSAEDLGEISPLLQTGMVSGYPGGTLAADQAINRAEAVALVGKIYASTGKKASFKDIIPAWSIAGIDSAVSAGIVSGYPDGSFHPERLLTKAEALSLAQNCLETYSKPRN